MVFLLRMAAACAAAAVLLWGPGNAHGGDVGKDVVRLALLVGSNQGTSGRNLLRYAEDDVGKMRRALLAVGGLDPANVVTLRGEDDVSLANAMRTLQDRAEKATREENASVILLFYYSGHSDGLNLELGESTVSFAKVKDWLESTTAAVRVAVVDACHSGGFAEVKGGRPGPAFDIFVDGDLTSTGMVVITSSSSGEKSQESDLVGGSYFTHHFVSGLYGAADVDGDARVTLQEVYRYAYRRTISSTLKTVVGTQHPTYEYALEGKGELILAMLSQATACIRFPKALAGEFFLLEKDSRELMAELSKDDKWARHLIVPRESTSWPGVEVSAWNPPNWCWTEPTTWRSPPASLPRTAPSSVGSAAAVPS